MRLAWMAIVMLLAGGCSLTGPSPVSILRNAEEVQSATTGPASAPSYYVRAYRQILSRPDRARVFAEIYRDASPAGRIYALAGLYESDRRTFDRLMASETVGWITYTDGCIVQRLTAQQTREKLVSGEFSRMWRRSR